MTKGSIPERLVVLMVAAFACSMGAARADEHPETSRVLVVWHDAHHLYPGTYDGVAREVATLFAPLDLEMHWQRAKQYDPGLDERTVLLRIVLMPSDPAGASWGLGEDVMGAVLPSNDRARSIYIFYNTLVRGLKIESRESHPYGLNERTLLERALGRVVAHEMIHAVAPAVPHSSWGLMRAGVTRSFLSRDDVVASGSVKQAFRAGVEEILSTTPASVVSGAMDRATPQAVRHDTEEPERSDGN